MDLYERVMEGLRRERDPEAYRIRMRRNKLRMRYADRLEAEIAHTAEKLALLRAIRDEPLDTPPGVP